MCSDCLDDIVAISSHGESLGAVDGFANCRGYEGLCCKTSDQVAETRLPGKAGSKVVACRIMLFCHLIIDGRNQIHALDVVRIRVCQVFEVNCQKV